MKSAKGFLHHLFVPHEKNNFRARALHHDFLLFYLILTFFFVSVVRYVQLGKDNVLGFATDVKTEKLLELINEKRQENNLGALTFNEKLALAASHKAQDMFAKDYWAHYAPDGKTPWNFLYESGYQYEFAGENLAKNFLFSKNVVDAWMNSPSHRDNILKQEYTEVGFAVVNGVLEGEETTLVVQMFGKPLPGTEVTRSESKKEAETKTIASAPSELAGVTTESKKQSLPISIPFNFFWFMTGFLTLALTLDLYFAYKMNIVRFHGKNIPHIIFILFISVGFVLFITKGGIL